MTTPIEMTELILKMYNSGWRMPANKSDTDTDLTKNGESGHFYLWTEEGIWVMCREEMISHKQRLCFRPSLRHAGGAHHVCCTLEYRICWREWRMVVCFGMLAAVWRSHDPQTHKSQRERVIQIKVLLNSKPTHKLQTPQITIIICVLKLKCVIFVPLVVAKVFWVI